MAENKTQPNHQSPSRFIASIEEAAKRRDSERISQWMEAASGEKPVMWGDAIVGFGSYHYRYASGREGDFLRIGFSPRKSGLSLYLMGDFEGFDALLKQLGKYKMGKACLTIKRLADVDEEVLQEIISRSATAPICSEIDT